VHILAQHPIPSSLDNVSGLRPLIDVGEEVASVPSPLEGLVEGELAISMSFLGSGEVLKPAQDGLGTEYGGGISSLYGGGGLFSNSGLRFMVKKTLQKILHFTFVICI
jgi:hypothetical protein